MTPGERGSSVAKKQKRLCIICRTRPAEVPDRNAMGRLVNRLCRQCHGDRLQGDLKLIERRRRVRERALRGLTRGFLYDIF